MSEVMEKVWSLLVTDFSKTAVFLTGVTIFAGGLNYLFQVLMGRLLGAAEFGTFGALLGLIYLLRVLYNGIEYSTTRYIAVLKDTAERRAFVRGWAIRVLLAAVLAGSILIGFRIPITAFLHVKDPRYIVLVAGVGGTLFLTAVALGATRGAEYFRLLGLNYLTLAGTRLVVGVALVLVGYGVYGALGGIIVANLLVTGVLGVALASAFRGKTAQPGRSYHSIYRYLIPATLVAFCFNVPTNADVILVKHFQDATTAGQYTAISVFGKGLLFLPYGIVRVMFPKVATADGPAQHDSEQMLSALVLTAGLVGTAGLVLSVAPQRLVKLFFGPAYTATAHLLPWYAAAIGAFSLAFVILNVSLARGNRRYPVAFALVTVTYVAVSYLFQFPPHMIVLAMGVCYAGLLAMGILLIVSPEPWHYTDYL